VGAVINRLRLRKVDRRLGRRERPLRLSRSGLRRLDGEGKGMVTKERTGRTRIQRGRSGGVGLRQGNGRDEGRVEQGLWVGWAGLGWGGRGKVIYPAEFGITDLPFDRLVVEHVVDSSASLMSPGFLSCAFATYASQSFPLVLFMLCPGSDCIHQIEPPNLCSSRPFA